MKAYKLEVLALDFGGENSLESMRVEIEQNRYFNMTLMDSQEKEIGEWHDNHPLNGRMTAKSEYDKLFNSENDMTLKERKSNLEKFMNAICKEVKCLPDYNDSLPDGGNAHVIKKIKELKSRTDKVFTYQRLSSNTSGIFVVDVKTGTETIIPTFGLDHNKQLVPKSEEKDTPLIDLFFDDLKPHIDNALEAFITKENVQDVDTLYIYGFIKNKKHMGILISANENRLINQNLE